MIATGRGNGASLPSHKIKSETLFATYYHELTELVNRFGRAANVHVTAEERNGEVIFLHAIEAGAADRSYGVHVARLAGVPDPVVGRADDVLTNLREEKAIEARGSERSSATNGKSGGEGSQQVVFDLGTGGFKTGRKEKERGSSGGRGDRTGIETTPATTPDERAVLDELREADLDGTAPIDLVREVRSWQARLDGGDGFDERDGPGER